MPDSLGVGWLGCLKGGEEGIGGEARPFIWVPGKVLVTAEALRGQMVCTTSKSLLFDL